MRARFALAVIIAGLCSAATGCKQRTDPAPFIAAINKSFVGRHECVWPEPVKLPAEVDPAKDERIRAFDALTDASLLIRETEIKSANQVSTKQTQKFDLSDKGQSAWLPDPNRAGYGNFCVGHFNATAINKATPNDPSNPTQYTVVYSYEVVGIPGWAMTPESMRAFHNIAADTAIQSATATLVKAPDGSWAIAAPQPSQ